MFRKLKEKLKEWKDKIIKSESKYEEKSVKKKKSNKKRKKEIKIPEKYNPIGKYEPDAEKLKKIIEEKKLENKKNIFSLFKYTKISEEDFEKYAEELEMILLENNVAFEVAEKIISQLKEQIINKEIDRKKIEETINNTLKEIIKNILKEPPNLITEIQNKENKPYVILFCGINGSGKTTTIAKIAKLLEKNKLKVVLAASDTFRAAAIDQLKQHAEKLKIPIIAHEYGSDPASVGFDAIKYAQKNKIDAVLIDTAGRMYTEKNLMAEIEKIAKVTRPDFKIFVGESITGNDATAQVKAFDESVHIDGIILTKSDIDEKGGTALSVGKTTGKPILYLGSGQNYEEIEKFDAEKFIEKLGI